MDRIREIGVFTRVVELGSFSKAADALTVSQSTVTTSIAQLELQLGVRLLNRNTRGISLTELGSLYYEKCKAALHELAEAENIISQRRVQLEGTLRISTSVAFGRRIVTPLLIDFMNRNASLRIDLSCDDNYVDLVSQGVDIALRMGRLADSSLGGRYLGRNPWVMVASPDYVENRGAPSEPAQLNKHDCIVYTTVQGDAVWHLQESNGISFPVYVYGRLRSNNLSTVLAATENGLGISILPQYVAQKALRRGQLVQVLMDYILPEQELHAVFPSPKLVSNNVLSLINFLKPKFQGDWWFDLSAQCWRKSVNSKQIQARAAKTIMGCKFPKATFACTSASSSDLRHTRLREAISLTTEHVSSQELLSNSAAKALALQAQYPARPLLAFKAALKKNREAQQ